MTNPTLPVLLNVLFGNAAKVPATPRNDLVATFLTGITGINKPAAATPSEMLRLNTATAVTPVSMQNDLGVLGGDLAGFPNGRRPYDDVVDVECAAARRAVRSRWHVRIARACRIRTQARRTPMALAPPDRARPTAS